MRRPQKQERRKSRRFRYNAALDPVEDLVLARRGG
jgi:hypothetical protein